MVDAVLLEWEGVLADTAARRDAMLQALLRRAWTSIASASRNAASVSTFIGGTRGAEEHGRADVVLAELVEMRAQRAFAERIGQGLTLYPGAKSFAERLAVGAPHRDRDVGVRSETAFVLRLAGLERLRRRCSPATTSRRRLRRLHSTAGDRAARARARRAAGAHQSRSWPATRAIRAARAAGVRTVAVHWRRMSPWKRMASCHRC